jgi:hypothetical protein
MSVEEALSLASVDLLNGIHEAMEHRKYLVAADIAITSMEPNTNHKFQKRLLRFVCKAVVLDSGVALVAEEQSVEAAFRTELPSSAKRLLSVCLLRALASNPDLFVEPVIRNRTFLLFDTNIPDIYKECKIDARRQTYESSRSFCILLTALLFRDAELFC